MIAPTLKGILLCDKVYFEGGKNTYQGEFKYILAPKYPATHQSLFIATKWGDGEGTEFKQEIKIIFEKQNLEIFNSKDFESEFRLTDVYQEHSVIGQISGLPLPDVGRYRIEVYLASELKGKMYFNAVLQPINVTNRVSNIIPQHT